MAAHDEVHLCSMVAFFINKTVGVRGAIEFARLEAKGEIVDEALVVVLLGRNELGVGVEDVGVEVRAHDVAFYLAGQGVEVVLVDNQNLGAVVLAEVLEGIEDVFLEGLGELSIVVEALEHVDPLVE